MHYTHMLLLLLALAPYSVSGMGDKRQENHINSTELSPDFALALVSIGVMRDLEQKVMNDRQRKGMDVFETMHTYSLNEFGWQGQVKKNTMHLKDKLKPYLDGKEKTVSNKIIKKLKGEDNISLFDACIDRFEKKGNTDFASLISLMPILFNSNVLKQNKYGAIMAFERHPQILNKALFGLKMPSLKSVDIWGFSEVITDSYFVDPSEKNNLSYIDKDQWRFVNQKIFYRVLTSDKYLASMTPMTQKEKESCWQDAFRPTFYDDCCDQEAVSRYRAQVEYMLLMNNRLKKAKGVGIEKRVLYPQIIVPLFEQEFTDFKNHCNTVEQELNKEITSAHIEDPEQKPFFNNFKGWYAQEKEECFKSLDFETVQKILSYKFGG